MSSLILPKHWRFNWPLLMGHLKKGSGGHLLKNSAGHLVNVCDTCPECTDYSRNWDVTISNIVTNIYNSSTSLPGLVVSGTRRWGYTETTDLTSTIDATHTIPIGSLAMSTFFPGTAVPCKRAVGSITVDVHGTFYISAAVASGAPRPSAYAGYAFTATLEITLEIWDKCGERMSGISIQASALAFDSSVVNLYFAGNGVLLYMDYADRVSCGTLPLGGDDVWFNAGSFYGYGIDGSLNTDSSRIAGSQIISSLAMTGSSGTAASAVPA